MDQATSRRRELWISLGLVAANLFVYAQVWYFDFVSYDDQYYLKESPYISSGLTFPGIKWAMTTFYFTNWHPLTWLSYMLDINIYGPNAGGFHLTNVVLHTVSAVLLFLLLRRLTGAELPSAFVAALFAVHPMHVESVAWVAERKDVLSGVFLMLALSAYGRYARRPGLSRYLLVALMFVLGLMSKPMIVTLPFLLLLLDYWPLRRMAFPGDAPGPGQESIWRLLDEKSPLLLIAAVSCFITLLAQSPNIALMDSLPLGARVANTANSYLAYAAKTFWPVNLTVFYPYPSKQSGWWMVACVLGLIAVSLAVIREARRRPYLAAGWFWYLGALVPVSGLVQTGDQAMADRYSYIPIIGLFIMAAWAGSELADRRPRLRVPLRVAAACAVLACMIVAHAQTGYWRGDKELWTHALDVSKENYVAESGLGSVFLSQGKVEEGLEHYKKAASYSRSSAQFYNTLGANLMKRGSVREALPYLVQAVKLKPGYAEAQSNLGLALSSLGDGDEAMVHDMAALRLDPTNVDVRDNLGIALARQGRVDEAVSRFVEALRLNPDFADGHYNLAVALFKKGRSAEAIENLRVTLRLKPDYADARRMLEDLTRGAPGP